MENENTAYLKTPIGKIKITANEKAVTSILFVFDDTEMLPENLNDIVLAGKQQLSEFFAGKRKEFTFPVEQKGTEFQNNVWTIVTTIPFGHTASYLDIARAIGDRGAIRAVGTANGKNQLSIVMPCHRVIGADGNLTGYAGGLWRKKWLLDHEKKYSGKDLQMELEL